MSKQILLTYSPKDFLKGIGPFQSGQSEVGGFFATASGIDMFRNPGFITQGSKGTLFTNAASLDGQLTTIDGATIGEGGINPFIYGLSSTKFWQFDLTQTPPTLTLSYLSNPFPHTIAASFAGLGHSIIQMGINGTLYTLAFTDTDIIRFNGTSSFIDPWGSVTPSGASALQSGVHRAVIFQTSLVLQGIYFTNGAYIGYIDGSVSGGGANGRMVDKAITLPLGFVARDIKVVQGQLEVYADNNVTSYILIWDGVSQNWSEIIAIEDQNVNAGVVNNGIPYLLTHGLMTGLTVRQKNFYGYPGLQYIFRTSHTPNGGGNMIDRINGQIIFSNVDKVYTYGNPYAQYSYRGQDANSQFPEGLHSPIIPKGTLAGGFVTSLKAVNGKILVGSTSGSNYYVESFVLNDATYDTNATWQTNFIQIPNDSTIDFIRFTIEPPTAGATFTPTLYTDYGTSAFATLPDITSANLDANGKSKTYYADQLNAPLCDNFALGGSYATSDGVHPIVITRIEVGVTVK